MTEKPTQDALERARAEIDAVDRELAALYVRRMQAVDAVAAYKKERGLPIEDKVREDAMLAREGDRVPSALRPYYLRVLQTLLDTSKDYQKETIGDSSIVLSSGALGRVGSLLPLSRRVLVLTDDGVPAAYAKAVADAANAPTLITLPAGEGNKCPETYLSLLRTMSDAGFTREDAVVAVGGGVICDLGGFVAATYMRGIDHLIFSTTLLAQIDASVGGKVAIDLDGCKNLVGCFYPARTVVIDPDVLSTLSPRQTSAGMAEAIKVFATSDAKSFERLEREGRAMPPSDVIRAALAVKLNVVARDPRERDLRRVLNFGHTVGHAIESVAAGDNEPLLHGECVGIGMLAMTEGEVRQRIKALLSRFDLPVTFTCERTALAKALRHDKKSGADCVTAVRVPVIGTFAFEKMTIEEIIAAGREVLTIR